MMKSNDVARMMMVATAVVGLFCAEKTVAQGGAVDGRLSAPTAGVDAGNSAVLSRESSPSPLLPAETSSSATDEGDKQKSSKTPEHGSLYNGSKEYSLTVVSMRREKHNGEERWSAPQANPTRVIEQLQGFVPTAIGEDKWGGRTDIKAKATGYFHTAKVGNRWWAIDPEGNAYFHKAVVSLGPGRSTDVQKVFQAKFGTMPQWMNDTRDLLLQNGFHGAGAWSQNDSIRNSPGQAEHPLAYTPIINFMGEYAVQKRGLKSMPDWSGYPQDTIFVFDPAFPAFADKQAQRMQAASEDPALFGYFSDNELPFKRNNLDGFLALPHDDPGYLAAHAWMQDHNASSPTDQLRIEFLAYEADTYFRIVTTAMRKYDTHHMYLGMRITARTEECPEVFRVLGKYADAISVNYYEVWTPDPRMLHMWAAESGKPEIITEFYTKAMDSGLSNTTGAGWLVGTQRDRGLFFQDYVLELIESGSIIGWHWFMYQDNDPGDNKVDPSNRDANKGIVNIRFEPYQPLLDRMKQVNDNAYSLADYFDRRSVK